MRADRGYRGKNRVLRLQLLETGVGGVGSVGRRGQFTNTADTTDTDSEKALEEIIPSDDEPKEQATLRREPVGTAQLSTGEWEEV